MIARAAIAPATTMISSPPTGSRASAAIRKKAAHTPWLETASVSVWVIDASVSMTSPA